MYPHLNNKHFFQSVIMLELNIIFVCIHVMAVEETFCDLATAKAQAFRAGISPVRRIERQRFRH